jgi:hypothetical protein
MFPLKPGAFGGTGAGVGSGFGAPANGFGGPDGGLGHPGGQLGFILNVLLPALVPEPAGGGGGPLGLESKSDIRYLVSEVITFALAAFKPGFIVA